MKLRSIRVRRLLFAALALDMVGYREAKLDGDALRVAGSILGARVGRVLTYDLRST
ncbi:MAG: hypothetical protein IPI44_12995 [Sulfuritalea sp.]|nr:hypothetical protein [Sulfuritalea sp.]MBK8118939.1 hypothetical protein [Sulfuritalea sp.]